MEIFYYVIAGIGLFGLLLYMANQGTQGGEPMRRGIGLKLFVCTLVVYMGFLLHWITGDITDFHSPMFFIQGVLIAPGLVILFVLMLFTPSVLSEAARWDQLSQKDPAPSLHKSQSIPYYDGELDESGYFSSTHQHKMEQENHRALPQALKYNLPENKVDQALREFRSGNVSRDKALEMMKDAVGRDAYDHRQGEFKNMLRK